MSLKKKRKSEFSEREARTKSSLDFATSFTIERLLAIAAAGEGCASPLLSASSCAKNQEQDKSTKTPTSASDASA